MTTPSGFQKIYDKDIKGTNYKIFNLKEICCKELRTKREYTLQAKYNGFLAVDKFSVVFVKVIC